jgi:hypothetical protein
LKQVNKERFDKKKIKDTVKEALNEFEKDRLKK